MLSRNLPITLIVGAAGFIGSHLTEKLLEKGVQIVGVDDLSAGNLTNLTAAAKDKHFYFLNQSLNTGLNLDLPRLDYGVFCISDDVSIHEHSLNFKLFLDLAFKSDFNPKILLVSSIDLYSSTNKNSPLAQAEKLLSNLSLGKKINARVVRLSGVYGPRMTFSSVDPILPVIRETLEGSLPDYSTSPDFSSRSLYIDDAIEVLTKALFHGGTAHKIYDGALLHPVKLSEVKQVLLDPTWHENKGFAPSELPPWPTPNLLKTQKELNWRPKVSLVSGLKQTIKYFKDGGQVRGQIADIKPQISEKESENKPEIKPVTSYQSPQAGQQPPKLDLTPLSRSIKKYAGLVLGGGLIFYALVWPLINLIAGVVLIRANLSAAAQNMTINNLPEAQIKVSLAKTAATELSQNQDGFLAVNLLRQLGLSNRVWEVGLDSLTDSVNAAQMALNGARDLNLSLKLISGQEEGALTQVLGASTQSFSEASGLFSLLESKLTQFKSGTLLSQVVNSWQKKLDFYQQTSLKLQTLSEILGSITSYDQRNYLIVLLDNSRLKPGGGLVSAGVLLKLDHGRFKSLENIDPEAGGNGTIIPPTELKNDLNLNSWTLKEAANDIDFSQTGGNLISLYQNQSGFKSDGVMAVDLTGLSLLLKSAGGVSLSQGQQVTDQNLLQFIQTSNDPSGLESEILSALIKKLLFVGTTDSLGLLQSLDQAILEKHLQLFFSENRVNNKLNSLGYLNKFPEYLSQDRERTVVIGAVDNNLSEKPVNFNIKKTSTIQVDLDQMGKETFKIDTTYTNTEAGSALKFRYKVYLPPGTKLTRFNWANRDLLAQVGGSSDYAQSGFSTVLEILPKEQKNLQLEFTNPGQIKIGSEFKYRLIIFKQPGTLAQPISIKISYPQNWKLISGQPEYTGLLDTDKTLQLEFK